MPEIEHDCVYEKLVENKNDILGIFAYSIYKRQEVEYLRSFEEKKGRPLQPQDMRDFRELCSSDTQLDLYKSQAIRLSQNFLDEALAEDLEEREVQYSERIHAELSKIKTGFWMGAAQSLFGSVLFVIFVGFIAFFSWSYGRGLEDTIESIFDVEIIPRQPVIPSE
ncbi:hypothetical protein [Synechococcus sp. PCC 7336]|uniref:hypothetical protein n=1 Tax=Synechococcus sp. PCC 7336 TaxID=195250 RepID=UPI0003776048|nr:hypothetical protein [Synechococcus sp. PCC 7336]